MRPRRVEEIRRKEPAGTGKRNVARHAGSTELIMEAVTSAEWSRILRSRSRMTQLMAARQHGKSRWWVQQSESGESRVRDRLLEPHEWAVLMRNRAHWNQQQLADALHVSRPWVSNMESNKVDPRRIVDFWRKRVTERV